MFFWSFFAKNHQLKPKKTKIFGDQNYHTKSYVDKD